MPHHFQKKFLWKKQLVSTGLIDKKIEISDSALKEIVTRYTREAGVRSLERNLAEVLRKIARLLTEKKKYPKKDRIEAILVTYDNDLISPEAIFKAEYEDKNYIMMNIFNFNKLIEESKYEERASFDTLYQGFLSFSGIPVWYDDELIRDILAYQFNKWKFNYERKFVNGLFPKYGNNIFRIDGIS